MKLNEREQILLLATVVIVLAVAGYLLGETIFGERRDVRRRIEQADARLAERRAVIAQSEQWEKRLRELRDTLPSFPEQMDVTTDLLNRLEDAANRRNLTLLRRDAERERRDGELYELTINCRWRGNLEALVYFLFDLQQEGMRFGVRQLSITPRGRGTLEGSMTIDGAYSRRRGQQDETVNPALSAYVTGEPSS